MNQVKVGDSVVITKGIFKGLLLEVKEVFGNSHITATDGDKTHAFKNDEFVLKDNAVEYLVKYASDLEEIVHYALRALDGLDSIKATSAAAKVRSFLNDLN